MYFADKSRQSLKKRLFWTPLLPALKVIMMHGAMAAFLKLYKAKKIRQKNQKKKKKRQRDKSLVFLNKKKDLVHMNMILYQYT